MHLEPFPPGADLRLRPYRREVFLRFYLFHLALRAHPGGVYFLIPWLADHFGWTDEEALWFAFLNGNTQHPVTSLVLHQSGPTPAHAASVVAAWRDLYDNLAWDTDRRYHRKSFAASVDSYLDLLAGRPQARFWADRSAAGWESLWDAATSIHGFGRLSAWSFLEYVKIVGFGADADHLMLADRDGSRSHRNGLCILAGLEHLDWHASNSDFDGNYDSATIAELEALAAELLEEARLRAPASIAGDVGYLTLESALCTYKSWHRPQRRYPGVYLDMHHDRVVDSAAALPSKVDADLWWQARSDSLPAWALLENRPGDPGVAPLKQDWYRVTGQVHTMGHADPSFYCDFDRAVDNCDWGVFR